MQRLLWVGLCLTIALGSALAATRPKVLVESAAADAVVVDFRGPIQRIGAARWQVADQEITLDDDTAIVERAGLTVPGMWASVRASWQDGGKLTAQQIETAQTMSLPAASPTMQDQPDLALLQSAAAPAAVVVRQEQPAPFQGRLILRVTATDPEQWSILVSAGPGQPWPVQGLVVDLDTTLIDERYGSIHPGVWIEGSAVPSPEGSLPWTVHSVRAQSDSSPQHGGVVLSIGGTAGLQLWQSDDHTVIVDSATQIDGVPRVGRYALVRGKMLSENTIWAAEARMRYVFRGWLIGRTDDASPRQWLIDVPRRAEAHDDIAGKVAVILDSSSLVDPTLDNDVLDVFVEVQAFATRQGWLVETVRLADFSVQ